MKVFPFLTAVVLIGSLGAVTRAGEATKEDLSACGLPHEERLLPDRNIREADKGHIFRFSDRTLHPFPGKPDKKTPGGLANFFARMQREKTGDLFYSRLHKGSLVAISGRIVDLGEHYLHELSGRHFDQPKPVFGAKDRTAHGEFTPGAIEAIGDGHCYLVETSDQKYALVRVIQQRGDQSLIQYVYQPSGTRSFEIPKGAVLKVATPSAPRTKQLPFGPHVAPVTVPGSVTDVPSLLAAREKAIAKLIAVVKRPASTYRECEAKLNAIDALGKLRAASAVDALIQEIDFRNRFLVSVHGTPDIAEDFPCIAALSLIGKPASIGSLTAIETMRVAGSPGDFTESELRMIKLLAVLERVEGFDVAVFMVRERVKVAPQESRQGLAFALKCLEKDPRARKRQ